MRPRPADHRPVSATVRDANASDIEAIRSVANDTWWDTYGELRDPEWIRSHLAEYYSPQLLARHIDEAGSLDGFHFLVAQVDGEVMGYLHFQQFEERGGPYLRRLYVHPLAQGGGLGRALVEELHRRLDPGTTYLLDVHYDNRKAIGFYRSFGAVPTGERLEPCWDYYRVTV